MPEGYTIAKVVRGVYIYFLRCGYRYGNICSIRASIYINPQFRSIIPCEVLLYIEVTFLGFIH